MRWDAIAGYYAVNFVLYGIKHHGYIVALSLAFIHYLLNQYNINQNKNIYSPRILLAIAIFTLSAFTSTAFPFPPSIILIVTGITDDKIVVLTRKRIHTSMHRNAARYGPIRT